MIKDVLIGFTLGCICILFLLSGCSPVEVKIVEEVVEVVAEDVVKEEEAKEHKRER